MAETHQWVELRWSAARTAQDEILGRVVGPYRAERAHRGETCRLFFIRDSLEDKPQLRVFLEVADGDIDLREVAAGARMPARVLPPTRSPLTVPATTIAGPRSERFVTDFLADVTGPLLTLLTRMWKGQANRTMVALDLMVAHVAAVDDFLTVPADAPMAALARRYRPVPLPFPSLRAHADGMLLMSKRPRELRERVEEWYQPRARSVEHRVHMLLQQIEDAAPDGSAPALAWHSTARHHRRLAELGLRAGELVIVDAEVEGFFSEQDLSQSPMHRFVADTPAIRKYMSRDVGYLSMRAMMSALYLALHSCLGITMSDRLLLCHAVSSACAALAGVAPSGLMQEIVDAAGSG